MIYCSHTLITCGEKVKSWHLRFEVDPRSYSFREPTVTITPRAVISQTAMSIINLLSGVGPERGF
jgi:hypothetical protein